MSLQQCVWLFFFASVALLEAPTILSWYDFLERNSENTYRDVVGKGATTKGGIVTEEGIHVTKEKPLQTTAKKDFELEVPRLTNISIYMAFDLDNYEGNILNISVPSESQPYETVDIIHINISASEEVQLCAVQYGLCTTKQRAKNLKHGLLFTLEKFENKALLTLSFSNGYKFLQTRHSWNPQNLILRLPIAKTDCSLYLLGVVGGVLTDRFYLQDLWHNGTYPKISCLDCSDVTRLQCFMGSSAVPMLNSRREYHCPCLWPWKYETGPARCTLPQPWRCDDIMCSVFCGQQKDSCVRCKSPFAAVERKGDYVKCGCPAHQALFDEKNCYNITAEGCGRGCLGKCLTTNHSLCAFGCRRTFTRLYEGTQFGECVCNGSLGYEYSTESCIKYGSHCLKTCNEYCDDRNETRCFQGCKNNLVFMDADGDFGMCRCANGRGYQDSSVDCHTFVDRCTRGCRQCKENNMNSCYGECLPSFNSSQYDGDFHECLCNSSSLYRESTRECVEVVDRNCDPSCFDKCARSNVSLCVSKCQTSFNVSDKDGDFVRCRCPDGTSFSAESKRCELLSDDFFIYWVIIAPTAGALLLALVIVTVCCVCRILRRKSELQALKLEVRFMKTKEKEDRAMEAVHKLEEERETIRGYDAAVSKRRAELRTLLEQYQQDPQATAQMQSLASEDQEHLNEQKTYAEALLKIDAELQHAQMRLATSANEAAILNSRLESTYPGATRKRRRPRICPVCNTQLATFANDCGHLACESCYEKLLEQHKPCPVCNAELGRGVNLSQGAS